MTRARLADVAVIAAILATFAVDLSAGARLTVGFLAIAYALLRAGVEIVRGGQAVIMGGER